MRLTIHLIALAIIAIAAALPAHAQNQTDTSACIPECAKIAQALAAQKKHQKCLEEHAGVEGTVACVETTVPAMTAEAILRAFGKCLEICRKQ